MAYGNLREFVAALEREGELLALNGSDLTWRYPR